IEKQAQPPAVFKLIAQAKGGDHKEFRTSVISLACGGADQIRTLYVRAVASDEIGAKKDLKVVAGDRDWLFPAQAHITKSNAIDPDGTFEARLGEEPPAVFEATAPCGPQEAAAGGCAA